MTPTAFPIEQTLVRPAARQKKKPAPKRRSVAGPRKALVGPKTLQQALARAVSPHRRCEIAQQSGDDAQAQKLTFAPYWRALVGRQLVGGSLHDLRHGMAHDPRSAAPGAQLEISVPALSKANAQRPTPAFWDVLAEVLATVDALPQTARIGRAKPLGATTPKALREIGQLLDRTRSFDGATLTLPPRIAQGARTSAKREQGGIKVQLRLRTGYGGLDRGRGTGAKGAENPYFRALLGLESADPGQGYLCATGSWKLAPDEAIREHGSDVVTRLPESLPVEVGEERPVPLPVTPQGYPNHRDRRVRLGTGKPRSPQLWRLLDAPATQGHRRTILTSLLDETAERSTQVRAYRWTIAIGFRWLKRGVQLDTLISVSPAGIARQGAVALLGYGLLLLSPEGGTLSLKALQRRLKTELQGAIFAAGGAEGRRQEQARPTSGSSPPRLRAAA